MIHHQVFIFGTFLFLSCSGEQTSGAIEDAEMDSTEIPAMDEEAFWENHVIDSAMLYVYSSDSAMQDTSLRSGSDIINRYNELNPYVIEEFTCVLSTDQIEQLQKMLTGDKLELNQGSSCFDPHHGFVMWDENGNQLGHISVCLACENYHIEPKAKEEMDIRDFQKIIESFDIPSNFAEMRQYAETGKWSEVN